MKKFLVGLLTGGVMECPDMTYNEPYLIIDATDKKNAVKIYNEKTNAYYFYGSVMAEIVDNAITNIDDYCSKQECIKAYNKAMKG